MGFFSNLLKSMSSSKCPNGYKVGGVTKEGIIYYDKIESPGEPKKLSTVEKERIMVQRVTTEDMLQFPSIPYQLNCPIQKQLEENTHPFAWMDLNAFNVEIAKRDLQLLNNQIIQARSYIPLLTSDYNINVSKIAFSKYSPSYGYTRLMCSPHTFTGKVSKYPLSLFFMTRGDIRTYSANGELFYTADGAFGKASVNIWKAPSDYSRPGTGWIFTFKMVEKSFVIVEAKTTLRPNEYGQATTVYKR